MEIDHNYLEKLAKANKWNEIDSEIDKMISSVNSPKDAGNLIRLYLEYLSRYFGFEKISVDNYLEVMSYYIQDTCEDSETKYDPNFWKDFLSIVITSLHRE